jgi:hypothetical protein
MRTSFSTRVLGLTIAASALGAAAATGAPRHASSCQALGNVKSFQGTVSPSYTDNVTATIEGAKSTDVIAIKDAGTVQVNLAGKQSGAVPMGANQTGTLVMFLGSVTGANVLSIDHSRGQPVRGHVTGKDLSVIRSAYLLLSPELCQYQIVVTYSVKTTFSGDKTYDPGSPVTIAAGSPREAIPDSLKLVGSADIPVYGTCGGGKERIPNPAGCYSFGGGWREDFEQYKLCHSDVPKGNCAVSGGLLGTATISWNLSPTY